MTNMHPAAVATPFPPLNPRNAEKRWPPKAEKATRQTHRSPLHPD